jgi:hypothetical protein
VGDRSYLPENHTRVCGRPAGLGPVRWEKPRRENPGVVARHDLHCRGLLHGAPRWTRTKNYEAGTYRLSVTGDDGIRMLVDGTQVIDGWFYQAPTTYTADVPLSEGAHRGRGVLPTHGRPGGQVQRVEGRRAPAVVSWTHRRVRSACRCRQASVRLSPASDLPARLRVDPTMEADRRYRRVKAGHHCFER